MAVPNDEGPALATPTPQEQSTEDAAIVAQADDERKAYATLQAEGAFQGYEVLQLPDGRLLSCRWGWCRLHRNLRDLARFLGKGWLA